MFQRAVLLRSVGLASLILLNACGQPGGPDTAAALEGTVRSADEGVMEGVVVSAKKDGSTIAVSVVSNDKGVYSFPADRLSPGHYTLTIRAGGYDLPSASGTEIVSGKSVKVDLNPTRMADPSARMSAADWLISVPGTQEQKSLLLNCSVCHSLDLPLMSMHSQAEFEPLITRMLGSYTHQSQPGDPQPLVKPRPVDPARVAEIAKYVSSINLSSSKDGKWSFPLKTLPRIKGAGTRVIITQYDLPRPMSQPHDVVTDPDGIAWYADFGRQFLGRLDPKTGAVKEYPIPVVHPEQPKGNLGVEADSEGTIWVAMHHQAAIGMFNPKTEKFKIFALPKNLHTPSTQLSQFSTLNHAVDGKIWTMTGGNTVARLDLKTERWETFYPFKNTQARPDELAAFKFMPGAGESSGPPVAGTGVPSVKSNGASHLVYGLISDSKNNCYILDFFGRSVFRIDAKTGNITEYPTKLPFSMPRRGSMDSQDRLWFAQFNADRIAMLDTRTGKMSEWKMPRPFTNPYDVALDKNGYAWTAGYQADRVIRLDPKTGSFTEYQLPLTTNVRRVFVDNHGPRPVFWVGSNHGASVIKVEPLD
ncbi:virginiamycin B lyase family protein [Sphingobium subterraneum]|uniref:Streptogramin lyase n=1 Tax=Sphingobium subterraneum TaxID=627688 RepID=A0A841IVV7_9SPHN|nr:carboxypeptidase regulatory-like domain-containing protein [Sphingobium subterraneum]MBB6123049.1 streptogramin lyase [Sphingobium subterraneum]